MNIERDQVHILSGVPMGVHPRWPHHPAAVPAAGIVGEAMMSIVLPGAFLEKFGGDSLEEIRRSYDAYLASLKTW